MGVLGVILTFSYSRAASRLRIGTGESRIGRDAARLISSCLFGNDPELPESLSQSDLKSAA